MSNIDVSNALIWVSCIVGFLLVSVITLSILAWKFYKGSFTKVKNKVSLNEKIQAFAMLAEHASYLVGVIAQMKAMIKCNGLLLKAGILEPNEEAKLSTQLQSLSRAVEDCSLTIEELSVRVEKAALLGETQENPESSVVNKE